jgi:heat shock protein HtpX
MEYSIIKQKFLLIIEGIAIFAVMLTLLTVIGIQLFGYAGIILVIGGVIFIVIIATRKTRFAQPDQVYQLPYAQAPELYSIIDGLAERAGIEATPDLYLYPVKYMNAATLDKPGKPMIILTPPMVQRLTRREMTAILAHEIAHIQYRDIFFLQLTQAVHMVTEIVAQTAWIMLLMFLPLFLFSQANLPLYVVGILFAAPVLSILLQLAFSRSREFNADLGAVELTGDPEALATALDKIEKVQSHLIKMILPFPKKGREESSLFRSHPAIPKRIEKLEKIAEAQQT